MAEALLRAKAIKGSVAFLTEEDVIAIILSPPYSAQGSSTQASEGGFAGKVCPAVKGAWTALRCHKHLVAWAHTVHLTLPQAGDTFCVLRPSLLPQHA